MGSDVYAAAGEAAFLGANLNARCCFASGQTKSYVTVTKMRFERETDSAVAEERKQSEGSFKLGLESPGE